MIIFSLSPFRPNWLHLS